MKDKYLRKLNIELVDGEFENPIQEQVRGPEQIYDIFQSIKDKAQETLLGVYLGDNLHIRVYSVLSLGSSKETLFSSKEIFKHAYLTESTYFVLIHNHPKGDPTPSESDKKVIEKLKEDAERLEFSFLDFIIVGADSYWSMFDEQDGGEYSLGSVT